MSRKLSLLFLFTLLNVCINAQEDNIGFEKDTADVEGISDESNIESDTIETTTIRTKDVYNIAYILPIQQNQIKLGDSKKTATYMPYRVKEALGFWEGAVLAFNENKEHDSSQKFIFHIWDNFKNDSVTQEVLNQMNNYEIDAVVAPFFTKRAIMVNEYCKKKGIPFFQAQNPSDIPVKDNSNSFKFHVPLNRTFYKFYNKINNDISYKNSNNILIYDISSKSQRRLKNYLNYKSKKDETNNIFSVPYNDFLNLGEIIDSNRKNVILVSLYKTKMVNKLISQLSKYSHADIEILGHHTWLNNRKIKYDTSFDYVVYSDFFIDNNISKVENVKQKYLEMTGDNIVFQTFQGYDVSRYIIEIFTRFGLDFPQYVETYKYYGAVTNIHMKPTYRSNGDLVFYENSSRMLLKRFGKEWLKIEY